MTILLDPAEKAQIEGRARGHALSTGEYVRRASQSYEAGVDEPALEAIAVEFEANVRAMRATLRDAVDYAQARLDEIAVVRGSRHGDR
ncbi:MAG: hypothetical protein H0X27_06210 [Caulobacteraceae bacterium]|nr:hypothetical protein [Caulobacteraceae bacterium]